MKMRTKIFIKACEYNLKGMAREKHRSVSTHRMGSLNSREKMHYSHMKSQRILFYKSHVIILILMSDHN